MDNFEIREIEHKYASKIISWTNGNTLRTSDIADQLDDFINEVLQYINKDKVK